MIERGASDEAREVYLDLKQRYRFLYGMGLQARLATQGQDIVDWWGIGRPGERRPPVATPEPRAPARWGDLPDRVRETIRAVAAERGVPVEKIMGYQHLASYAQARQECYRRLRAMPWRGGHPSLLQIGLWLHRDHTTVHHGLKRG
jgi:hypothetical protein